MVMILSIIVLSKYFDMVRYGTVIIQLKHFGKKMVRFDRIIDWYGILVKKKKKTAPQHTCIYYYIFL